MNGSARTVLFADGTALNAHSVILATGVTYRQLTAPGLAPLTGRGVYYGSALTEADRLHRQDIYVVGGANSAGQAAVYLASGARSVTILVRGTSLTNSMSHYLIEQVDSGPRIRVRTCTEASARTAHDHLEQADAARQQHRRDRDASIMRSGCSVHRRGAADRLAGRRGAARRARLRPDRA